MDLLPNFESICEHMVEKFGDKDAKKIHFSKQMELCKMSNLGIEEPKIFKAVKFACKSIHGRGAASGIRLTYAYFEEADHIEFSPCRIGNI